MSSRIALQPAYVLHARPYGDTSLLMEVFSLEYGRVGLVARGARRPGARMRAALQPFRSLLLSWSGRGDLFTMSAVEEAGATYVLQGEALIAGFYVNELLVRLTQRHDPYVGLFTVYSQTLESLATQPALQPILRLFEKNLLEELGYGLALEEDVQGNPIQPERNYQYQVETGAVALESEAPMGGNSVRGATLLALGRNEPLSQEGLGEAKRLMRYVLAHYLGASPLRTRQLFRDLNQG